ncbi:MAG: TetR/AcrR family transcriptional regulator [Negativicutes bacterium]|nr:TetR/AcrR family transcriptional regulator [Negativicutes bacterium]
MKDIKNFILDKAKERAERFGFKKTTMDEISRDCGISKKTIYEHFADKEDMFRSLVIRESQRAIQLLFGQVEDVLHPLDKITCLVRNAISYFNEDHFITKVLKGDEMKLTLSDNSYKDIVEEEVISLIAGIIREGKQRGVFREVDEEITAYAGYKLFQAFTYARTGPLRRRQNEQYYSEALLDFILKGVTKQ